VNALLSALAAAAEAPSQLLPARTQMGFTLGAHIILVPLGVVFPLMILIANYLGLRRGEEAATWRAPADGIRDDILEHGVSERGVLRQHYDTDALDASVLLAAIFGFLPGDDTRLRATVDAIAEQLTEDGFVLRYRTTDDGLSGKEGTFLICSFWLVSALAIIGELQRACDLMERLLRVASPLGLYAEEFDADTGRHLGNFPQAFSHLALMEAAARIIVPEMLEEY
jgi:GH15 family glucan-1,4-alpha-glucosidase